MAANKRSNLSGYGGSRYTVNTTNTNTSPYDSGQIKCYHCQINEATTRGKIANEFIKKNDILKGSFLFWMIIVYTK